jgi:hypothetical protein
VTATTDGPWRIDVAADGNGPAQVVSFAAIGGGPAVTLDAEPAHPSGGMTLTVAAAGISDAAGFARLVRPNGEVSTRDLVPRPDGRLETVIDAGDLPGQGLVTVTVQGLDAGVPITREVARAVMVGSRRIRLDRTYRERPLDEDRDGRYEALQVDVGLVSDSAGDGALTLEVVGEADEPFSAARTTASATFTAPAGPYTVTLRLRGAELAAARTGAFVVRDVRLEDLTATGAVPADHDATGFTTAPYDTGLFGPLRQIWLPVSLRPLWR